MTSHPTPEPRDQYELIATMSYSDINSVTGYTCANCGRGSGMYGHFNPSTNDFSCVARELGESSHVE